MTRRRPRKPTAAPAVAPDPFGFDYEPDPFGLAVTETPQAGLSRRDQAEDVNPMFYAVLRAHLAVLDDGKPVTQTNIARAMGLRHREYLYRLYRRFPRLKDWIAEQLSKHVEREVATVRSKLAQQAVFGSIKAAETLRRFEEMRLPASRGRYGEMEAPNQPGVAQGVQINLLVPRPPELDMPAGFDGQVRVSSKVLDAPADLGKAVAAAAQVDAAPDVEIAAGDPLDAVAVLSPATSNGR